MRSRHAVRPLLVTVTVGLLALGSFGTSTALGSPSQCARGDLGIKPGASNGALGTIENAMILRNVSGSTCTLKGYPTLGRWSKIGRPLATKTVKKWSFQPKLVTLHPKDRATFIMKWSDVESGPRACPITPVLQTIAPGDSRPLIIRFSMQVCRRTITVSPVEKGVHSP